MALIIDGKKTAADIKAELKNEIEDFKKTSGVTPKLALLLVGDDSASKVYVRNKERSCAEVGMESLVLRLPSETTEEEVLSIVSQWNSDKSIHGILVQLPLPKQISETKVLLSILPSKDVDGFHPENVGRLVAGMPSYVPCTPLGIYELLRRYNIETKGKHCVVLGRSNIVGKPIANLLYQKAPHANSIVTICHTAAPDLSYYTRQADILIAAVGVPELIKSEHVKDGVVIIDVGINQVETDDNEKKYKIVGDVDFHGVEPKAAAITPVPGGVGPMTIAMLMKNTLRSAKKEVYI